MFHGQRKRSRRPNETRLHNSQKASLSDRLILRAGYEDVKESGSLSCEIDFGVNPFTL